MSKQAPPKAAMRVVGLPPSPGNLVDRAAGGEVGAFEELYRENVGRIYLLCLRMCGNPTLAEELTQEAFVRAWRKLGSFRGESAFSTWLHRVAVNVVLGGGRSTALREARVKPVGDDLSVNFAFGFGSHQLAYLQTQIFPQFHINRAGLFRRFVLKNPGHLSCAND